MSDVNSFLVSVIAYVEGKSDEFDERDIISFLNNVKNSKNIISHYLVGLAFKEMKHLLRLLDSLHLMEERLFSAQNIADASKDELSKLHFLITQSVEKTFNMLIDVSNKIDPKALRDFNPTAELSYLSVGAKGILPPGMDPDQFSRESRERMRNILNRVLQESNAAVTPPEAVPAVPIDTK